MKVVILHHDLEGAEKRMGKLFEDKGFKVTFLDIRDLDVNNFPECDCVLNRIYASVANRNCESNSKVLKLLNSLEEKGVFCLNSYSATSFDYSKYKSFLKMKSDKVQTPKTLFIDSTGKKDKILKFVEEIRYPLIVKRDMGGRGKDVYKIDSEKDLFVKLEEVFGEDGQYNQGFIIQEFVKSNREYDCRIAIIDGEFAFSYSRSLIEVKQGEGNWLASINRGSKIQEYKPSGEEIELAKKATGSIGAIFNEVDMCFCENGPVIIENNPTPNYEVGVEDYLIVNAVNLIEKKILERK